MPIISDRGKSLLAESRKIIDKVFGASNVKFWHYFITAGSNFLYFTKKKNVLKCFLFRYGRYLTRTKFRLHRFRSVLFVVVMATSILLKEHQVKPPFEPVNVEIILFNNIDINPPERLL